MPPPPRDTVNAWLRCWAKMKGDKPAFIFRGAAPGNKRHVLTCREVYNLATAASLLMLKAGLEYGQVVLNTLPNSPERVIMDLGCMLIGVATLNGMLHLLDGEDLVKCMIRGRCSALVIDPTRQPNVLQILGDRVIVRGENVRSHLVLTLKKIFNVDCGGGAEHRPWLEQLKQRPTEQLEPVKPDGLAIFFNTTGTTAFSRLVPKTQKQFLQMGQVLHDLMRLEAHDILFNARSLGWHDGTCSQFVVGGTTRVLVDMTVPPKDPVAFSWEACQSEHCTAVFLLPSDISHLLATPSLRNGKKYKPHTMITGSMPVSQQQASVVGVLCKELLIVQSSAETGVLSYHRLTENNTQHFEDGDYGEPADDYAFKLCTLDGTDIPPSEMGRPGLVQVKGSQLSAPVDASGAIMVTEGWMATDHVAFYNASQHLQAVCHTNNIILHGAYPICPFWLEKKLEECPGVVKVVIVPVPDPAMFQEMCACVLPEHNLVMKDAEVRAFCRTIFVEGALECSYIPRYYLFLKDIPSIPLTESEPDRAKLFLMALKALKLSVTAL